MRRLIEVSRFAVIIPSVASIIGAIVLMFLGSIEIVRSAANVVLKQEPLKDTVVAILTSVDAILLGTVLLVIGYGLYELFVDTNLEVPDWLEINTLDDLKAKLIGVVVAIIAVIFVGVLVDAKSPNEVMYYGVGAGAVVLALAAFSFTSKK
ncbi:unannotated protein [freshwater metagenome]|jgi:uncharacterized membrane protein YqhA|uniref:Unannotated protein n=1 Tax=freshwater metagenome TaxID=449393 RepID=A0A6J6Q3Z2_9ZZZZ|nr:hypothetical protein [Actinomycetota bacterium]MSW25384.1 hypothetical protein [Actinomycetota bacterium]MSX43149.1 hypothetical protein [Actinomycetota bacterium]MSX98150.1 hypothetical protein [Actinomycetota bacterium]MSY53445.1 hypothetical protein [Actinomycetota bacterium]